MHISNPETSPMQATQVYERAPYIVNTNTSHCQSRRDFNELLTIVGANQIYVIEDLSFCELDKEVIPITLSHLKLILSTTSRHFLNSVEPGIIVIVMIMSENNNC